MKKYTKKQLEAMDIEEILDIADRYSKKVDDIRGYASGMNRARRRLLGKETNIECILSEQKTFHLSDD